MATDDKYLLQFSKAVENYDSAHKASLAAGNIANARKKNVTEAFKIILKEKNLPFGTKIRHKDILYGYGPTVSETIPSDKWLELYEKKLISRSQFLAPLSVAKGKAEESAGVDMTMRITLSKKGDKSDLRKEDFKGTYTTPIQIITPELHIKKRTTSIKLPIKPLLKRKINLTLTR